jgi:hypothetical protein
MIAGQLAIIIAAVFAGAAIDVHILCAAALGGQPWRFSNTLLTMVVHAWPRTYGGIARN